MPESRQPTHHGYAVNVKSHGRYDYSDALAGGPARGRAPGGGRAGGGAPYWEARDVITL
jgi:hypothetical protein